MTPPNAAQSGAAAGTRLTGAHLTEDEFGELLSQSTEAFGTTPAEVHLRCCEQCFAEFASLRESISFFREASTAYADNELRDIPQVKLPARRPIVFPVTHTAYWAVAAAIVLAAFLPLQLLHRSSAKPAPVAIAAAAPAVPAQSDEALLDDVNREISASVPDPMQALADPTAEVSATSDAATGDEDSAPTSTQRKD